MRDDDRFENSFLLLIIEFLSADGHGSFHAGECLFNDCHNNVLSELTSLYMNEELTGVQIPLYKLNKHDMIFTNEGVTDG